MATQYSSKYFTWSNHYVSTFMTDLPDQGHGIKSRVFEDACDEGFEVVSTKTGRIVRFIFVTESLDREGELRGWLFRGWDPEVKNFTLIVYND
jgi:hypothetical protein